MRNREKIARVDRAIRWIIVVWLIIVFLIIIFGAPRLLPRSRHSGRKPHVFAIYSARKNARMPARARASVRTQTG